jgi:hypothetical protein
MTGEHATQRSARMHMKGHENTNTVHPDRCDLAAAWAARTLITPAAFLHAATHRHSIKDIAVELSVLPEDVNAYLGVLSVEEFKIMRRLVGHALV